MLTPLSAGGSSFMISIRGSFAIFLVSNYNGSERKILFLHFIGCRRCAKGELDLQG